MNCHRIKGKQNAVFIVASMICNDIMLYEVKSKFIENPPCSGGTFVIIMWSAVL